MATNKRQTTRQFKQSDEPRKPEQRSSCGEIWIGTSGWVYPHWKRRFYPPEVPATQYLHYYASHFDTAEINNSFYRLPTQATYQKWAATVPDGFTFAVKGSRYLSHMKKLKDPEDPWSRIISTAGELKDRLGPILLQFPASWPKNMERLREFLELEQVAGRRVVLEFRHQTWFSNDVYRLLEKHGVALCIADSTVFPRRDVITADFTYLRYHGRERLYAADYSDADLQVEARLIEKWRNQGIDVFAYFNNDGEARAVANAKTLKRFLSVESPRRSA